MTDTPPPEFGEPVVLAYVHSNDVAYSWHHSMIELVGWDITNHGRVMQGGYIAMRCGTDGLVDARNKAVQTFLDEARAEWMFWLDTDMGFPPDTLDRLFEVADPQERPIIGALCFTQREHRSDEIGGWHCVATPTVFDWAKVDDQMGFAVRWDYPLNTVTQVAGTGSACILIHKTVFERIRDEHGPVWYNRIPNTTTGQVVGEDLSFCMRAGALGIPIYVHTGVKTTHFKQLWLGEEEYWKQRAVNPPPIDVPVRTAVIVPVMRRPQNAAPFMESLRQSTSQATVYAVADKGDVDTIDAWSDAGATVLTVDGDEPGTFAEKVNHGYRETAEPWLFITGDDVRFHQGWLGKAQGMAGTRFHVVGTNDLGNPRVMSGEHGTHLLIRREYVDEMGASWDGPKTVAHEGYRHCFVDDEIVTVAKQRSVWVSAPESVVEHMHPVWGKGEMDAVYQIGQSHLARDKRLFDLRVRGNL